MAHRSGRRVGRQGRKRLPEPETAGPKPVGLLSKSGAPVPLQAVDVSANVVDFLAEVTIKQTYVNSTGSKLEAVYTFPLDSQGEVCRNVVHAATPPRRRVAQQA